VDKHGWQVKPCDPSLIRANLNALEMSIAHVIKRCTNALFTETPFTRYNRFDNRVERTATVHSTGCQTGLSNRFDNRLYTPYSRLSVRLSNGFDNRLNVCIHDTTGCQTPVVSCIPTLTRLSNPFDNRFDTRLYRVNGALQSPPSIA